MKRIVVLVSVLLLVMSAMPVRVPGAAASAASKVAGKKVCKTVKRHGKSKKVCHTVKPKPKATPKPTATPAPVDMAQKLADTLTSATSDDARTATLLNVFKTIHVGVYNGQTGDPIVTGMETNKNDVYFYDAEVNELATAFGRKQTYTFDDLARLFTSLGMGTVDSTGVAALEQNLAKWGLQHQQEPAALVPLLVRDLGQKHDTAYDLATVDHPENVMLDPLQLELISLQLLAPIQHAAAQAKTTFRDHMPAHYGICTVIKVALNPFNPDTYLPDSAQIHTIIDGLTGAILPSAVAVFIKQVETFNNEWGDKIGMAGTIASALHGLLLAYGLKVESGPTGGVLTTHKGLAGHAPDAGKQLRFQARVTMQDKIPDWLRSCLHDAGYDIPDQGPVPGVEISWNNGGLLGIGGTHLEDYGSVSYEPSDEKTSDGTTGPKGVETKVFTPADEPVPGMGKVVTVNGEETPRALWGMAFTNPLGTVSELLFPMQGEELDWSLTYHKPRGFQFSNITAHFDMYDEAHHFVGSAEYTYSGHMCGDNPYSGNWDVTGHATSTSSDGRTSTYTLPNGAGGQLLEHPISIQDFYGLWHLNANGGQPTISLTIGIGSAFTPARQTVSVPLVEDMDCPDNSGS